MVDFTLVYGMRLYHGPAEELERVEPMEIRLVEGGQPLRVTAHVIEGASREEIRRQLLLSVDAFFDLH